MASKMRRLRWNEMSSYSFDCYEILKSILILELIKRDFKFSIRPNKVSTIVSEQVYNKASTCDKPIEGSEECRSCTLGI